MPRNQIWIQTTAEWSSVESRLYRRVVKFGDFHLKSSGEDGRSRGKDEDKDGAVALECHAAIHGDFDSKCLSKRWRCERAF